MTQPNIQSVIRSESQSSSQSNIQLRRRTRFNALANLITISLLTLVTASCHSFMSKVPGSEGSDPETTSLNSYENLSKVIFSPKCVGCHSASNAKGGVDMGSYSGLLHSQGLILPGHAESSLLYSEVASGGMPEGGPPLSHREISAISDWINAGAPDGDFASSEPPPPLATPAPTPTPSTPRPLPSTPKYADIQTMLFDKSCVRCHSSSKASGNVNLASYQKLMGNARPKVIQPGDAFKSIVYTEIEKGSMPPRGGRIDPNLQKLLKDWINAGAQN